MLAKILVFGLSWALVVATHHWNEDDKHSAPQPYRFGYEVKDKEGSQYRHEEGDGHGSVKGSYGYTDDKGLHREVHYVADKNGFRASVKTNEPGTSNQDPAHVEVVSHAKHTEHHIGKHTPHIPYHNTVKHVQHVPVYHNTVKHIPHAPVYRETVKHIPHVVPSYHKVKISPISSIKPLKHYRSYNTHSFSPISGYSYKPTSSLKYKPLLGINEGFGKGFGSIPNYGGSLGLSSLENIDGFDSYNSNYQNDDVIEKLIEEAKNKGHYTNIDGLSGYGSSVGMSGLSNLNGLGVSSMPSSLSGLNNFYGLSGSSIGSGLNGLDGTNDGKIEKIIEDLKHKNNYNNNGRNNNFHGNNFEIREFRNIGNHKYSRSSDKEY